MSLVYSAMTTESQEVKSSVLKQISKDKCGQCNEPRQEHSKKNMIRCMYRADAYLYQAVLKINELSKKLKDEEDVEKA